MTNERAGISRLVLVGEGLSLKRSAWGVITITLAAAALGGRMVWDGLFSCVAGCFLPQAGMLGASRQLLAGVLQHPLSAVIGLGPAQLGWFYLVLGLSWIGALTALWSQQRWGWSVALVLTLLSFTYPGGGTLLSVVLLFALFVPSTRLWLRE